MSQQATSTQLDELVQKIVTAQQPTLLQTAAETAERVVEDVLKRRESRLIDDVSEELKKSSALDKVTLRTPGNRDQFNHGKDVLEKINSATKSINSGDANKAKDILEEGKKSINKRLKLIRIDREDWATVQEYLSDDLASDSEDEKQINRAIKNATSKKEKLARKKPQANRFFPYRRNQPLQKFNYLTQGVSQTSTFRPQSVTNERVCWSCGRRGHTQYLLMIINIRDWEFEEKL